MDAEGQVEVREEAPQTGEGVAQQKQSNLSSGDFPMTKANPADPMGPIVIEEPSYQSPLRVTVVDPFNPP